MEKRRYGATLPLLLCLVLAGLGIGCGGSSGSNPAPTPTPIVDNDPVVKSGGVYRLANRTRLIQPNDSWSYQLKAINEDMTSTIGGVGTLQAVTDPTSIFGLGNTLKVTASTVMDGGITFGAIVHGRSEKAAPRLRVFDVLTDSVSQVGTLSMLPGEWTTTTEFDSNTTRQNDASVEYHSKLTVTGTEFVTTAAGTFECWKCEVERNFLTPGTQKGTFWFAPQLGSYVKAVYKFTPPGGVELEFTEKLTSASMLPTP